MTDLTALLAELRATRDRYTAAIDVLDVIAQNHQPPAAERTLPSGVRVYKLSAETRRRMSLAQQKRHAERKVRR